MRWPMSFDATLIGDAGPGATDAKAAVRASGGEVRERIGWDAVAGAVAAGERSILLIEAEGVDPDTLSAALEAIGEQAAAGDAFVVVVIDETQIDAVATVIGPRTQILCRPTMAERVAAIAMARLAVTSGVREDGPGGDAARLAHVNAEIARIAEMLVRLSGENAPGDERAGVGDRRRDYGTAPAEPAAITAGEVRGALRARRMRDQFLGAGLFEDPAWDMLLDLFAAELEEVRVSVSSLCIAAAVAPTTALRWIGRLIEVGLLERRPDPRDRRRAFMALSQRGRDGINRYFGALRSAGLAIG